jgi:hypothetical protein
MESPFHLIWKFIMARIKTLAATSALAVLALAGAPSMASAAANLIVNGDFSSPAIYPNWALYPSIPGWTSETADQIEVGASPIYGLSCYTGTCQNLEVNATMLGAVTQTVTGLTASDTYNFTWAYGSRPGGGPQQLDVYVNGALKAIDYSNASNYGKWKFNYISLTGLTSAKIEFVSVDAGGLTGYGNEVTAVSLSAVPEPAAWALMLVGFGGLGAMMRRKNSLAAVGA